MKNKILIIVSCISIIISIFFTNKTISRYNFINELNFEMISAACNVDILKGNYYINDITHTIPIVLSNNNDYVLKGNIVFNNEIIEEFILNKKEKNKIFNISFAEDTYNSFNSNETYYFTINFLDPYTNTYSEIVSFQKKQLPVSINNIETYINDVLVENTEITNNEDTIIINNNLSETNSNIMYKITFINNESTVIYKIKNINEILNSNTKSSYKLKIMNTDGILEELNVSKGIEIEDYLDLYVVYNYDSSINDNSNKTIINYEFKLEYTDIPSKNALITASSYANSSSDNFG